MKAKNFVLFYDLVTLVPVVQPLENIHVLSCIGGSVNQFISGSRREVCMVTIKIILQHN